MQTIIDFIVKLVGDLGYFGIFFMMFLESSFIPFPSEVVMIPAGYLAYQGEMNFFVAVFFGILGSLAGALLNYYLALFFGREILIKYGKYVFFDEETMKKMEDFFAKHGHISTFSGRLIAVYFTSCWAWKNEFSDFLFLYFFGGRNLEFDSCGFRVFFGAK